MAPEIKLTEADMLTRLRVHLGAQGEQYAVVSHPRDAAGFDASRTLDAISMGLWPSRGLLLQGYEIKVSRSDWQRELKDPAKAERFCRLVDHFWLVVSDRKIVQDGELPPHWGLLVPHGDKLRKAVAPTYLHEHTAGKRVPLPPGFGRSFLASLMREAVREGDVQPEAIQVAVREALERDRAARVRSSRDWEKMYTDIHAKLREFETGLGCGIASFQYSGLDPKTVGKRLQAIAVGEADVDRLESRLRQLEGTADRTLSDIRGHLTDLSARVQ